MNLLKNLVTTHKLLEDEIVTESNLFPDVDTIRLDPDRVDVYDIVSHLLPTIVKISYTFLHADKIKHERKYGSDDPDTEEDDKFAFNKSALRDEIQQVIQHLTDRLEGLTYTDFDNTIDAVSKEFKYPLDKEKTK